MVLHCWADGPARVVGEWPDWKEIGSTCMLAAGHEGEREFIPDDEIGVTFLPAHGAADDRRNASAVLPAAVQSPVLAVCVWALKANDGQ